MQHGQVLVANEKGEGSQHAHRPNSVHLCFFYSLGYIYLGRSRRSEAMCGLCMRKTPGVVCRILESTLGPAPLGLHSSEKAIKLALNIINLDPCPELQPLHRFRKFTGIKVFKLPRVIPPLDSLAELFVHPSPAEDWRECRAGRGPGRLDIQHDGTRSRCP